MFPLIPVEETLIEGSFRRSSPRLFNVLTAFVSDYRCALSREILIQGRLFVSESFLSFRANILGELLLLPPRDHD